MLIVDDCWLRLPNQHQPPIQQFFELIGLWLGRQSSSTTSFLQLAHSEERAEKKWKFVDWAAAIAQTSLSFNTADAFITIQSSLLY